jgi:hypothetical protein
MTPCRRPSTSSDASTARGLRVTALAMQFVAGDAVYALHLSDERLPFAGETYGHAGIEGSLREMRRQFDYLVYRPHGIVRRRRRPYARRTHLSPSGKRRTSHRKFPNRIHRARRQGLARGGVLRPRHGGIFHAPVCDAASTARSCVQCGGGVRFVTFSRFKVLRKRTRIIGVARCERIC